MLWCLCAALSSATAAHWKLFSLCYLSINSSGMTAVSLLTKCRMTRKYVLCEHSRSLFFLVYTQSMKHVNIVVYAHLSVIH